MLSFLLAHLKDIASIFKLILLFLVGILMGVLVRRWRQGI